MRMHWLCVTLTGFVAVAAWPALAAAHGMAGQRFFPSTLTIDDPFVADELSLPTILHIKQPGDSEGQAGQFTNNSGEVFQRLFPHLLGTPRRAVDLLHPSPHR